MSYIPTSDSAVNYADADARSAADLHHEQCRLITGLCKTGDNVTHLKRITNASYLSEINDFILSRSSPSPGTPTAAVKVDRLHINRTDIPSSLSSSAVLD